MTNMFDNRPFSFHILNNRQSKISLHAVNDTTTAKIYKRIYYAPRKISGDHIVAALSVRQSVRTSHLCSAHNFFI